MKWIAFRDGKPVGKFRFFSDYDNWLANHPQTRCVDYLYNGESGTWMRSIVSSRYMKHWEDIGAAGVPAELKAWVLIL